MNTYQPVRPGRSAPSGTPVVHAPHAALLIDFDNVTLGIRSDLTKELRTLLDSDIIRGKVAVQRAYADWRRYPQYIVPLSESSIDLIFAPAFGTNKKNATDIRLAVDAIELVFTRPEIGTFILLSGDSDFSSLVIKLKEYGKYVIGVGIRESASDLLIQNCDEYYSYNDLAGLTREEEVTSVQRDPWELVVEAVEAMARDDDVMRSDRLKQVMQQLDPNFDEKNAGFNRFSKFVTEAANRGLIRITKLDNGQYEVASAQGALLPKSAAAAPPPRAPAAAAGGDENGRRARRGRRGRGREREREKEPAAAQAPSQPPPAPSPTPSPKRPRAAGSLTLAEAFHLMQQALGELPAPVPHEKLRARMLALLGREDPLLDPNRFPRFLRQANDAEAADVRKLEDDVYEVSPHRVQRALEGGTAVKAEEPVLPATPLGPAVMPEPTPPGAAAPAAEPRTLRALRFRRGSRGPLRPTEVPLVGAVKMEDSERPPVPRDRSPRSRGIPRPAARAEAESVPKAVSAEPPKPPKPSARPPRSRRAAPASAGATPAATPPAEDPAKRAPRQGGRARPRKDRGKGGAGGGK